MTHVLMLGWEYPPFITGGLGTACEGLTKALSRQGVKITFIIPHIQGGERADHMQLRSPYTLLQEQALQEQAYNSPEHFQTEGSCDLQSYEALAILNEARKLQHPGSSQVESGETGKFISTRGISTIKIPAFLKPYWSEVQYREALKYFFKREKGKQAGIGLTDLELQVFPSEPAAPESGEDLTPHSRYSPKEEHYGSSLFEEVARYTALVLSASEHLPFDIIHAHDWMTFPAGVALAEQTGRPLVVHVHSLEFDRSGSNGNPAIKEIEKLGTTKASAVIAVSHYTRSIIANEHGIPKEKISVSHNGVYPREVVLHYQKSKPADEKWVLFLGRVTFQKGPDYFIEAAAKVIPHVPGVKFVLAGNGDMLPRLQHRVYELGIQDYVRFPGFLRGRAVEEAFLNADLYVMPSVSEPFGLAALEAISFDTPALISRQTGVSEVLEHTLKFDFWDVDRLADLIINALQFGELREDMLESARRELTKLRWDASAERVKHIYDTLVP